MAFTLGTSTLAGDGLVANVDTELRGYGPHLAIKFRNANASEEFSIRRATPVYRTIGNVRKRKAGVV